MSIREIVWNCTRRRTGPLSASGNACSTSCAPASYSSLACSLRITLSLAYFTLERLKKGQTRMTGDPAYKASLLIVSDCDSRGVEGMKYLFVEVHARKVSTFIVAIECTYRVRYCS